MWRAHSTPTVGWSILVLNGPFWGVLGAWSFTPLTSSKRWETQEAAEAFRVGGLSEEQGAVMLAASVAE